MKKRKASEIDNAEQIKRSDAVMGKFVNIAKNDMSFSSKEIMQHDLTEVYIIAFVLLCPQFLVHLLPKLCL